MASTTPPPYLQLPKGAQETWRPAGCMPPRCLDTIATADGVGGVVETRPSPCGEGTEINVHFRCGRDGLALGQMRLFVQWDKQGRVGMEAGLDWRDRGVVCRDTARRLVHGEPRRLPGRRTWILVSQALDNLRLLGREIQSRFGPLLWLPHPQVPTSNPQVDIRLDSRGVPDHEAEMCALLLLELPVRFGQTDLDVCLYQESSLRREDRHERYKERASAIGKLWAKLLGQSQAGTSGERHLWVNRLTREGWPCVQVLINELMASTGGRQWALFVGNADRTGNELVGVPRDLPAFLAKDPHSGGGAAGLVDKLSITIDNRRGDWALADPQVRLASVLSDLGPCGVRVQLCLTLVLEPKQSPPPLHDRLAQALAACKHDFCLQVIPQSQGTPVTARVVSERLAAVLAMGCPSFEATEAGWGARADGRAWEWFSTPGKPRTTLDCSRRMAVEDWQWVSDAPHVRGVLQVSGIPQLPETIALSMAYTERPRAQFGQHIASMWCGAAPTKRPDERPAT